MMIARRALIAAMAAIAGLAVPAALAQPYPSRPIKIIVPTPRAVRST